MKNIKLNLAVNTGKILGYEAASNEIGVCVPEGYASVIDNALEQGYEIYYRNGSFIKRGKDDPKFEDELKQIENQLKQIIIESKIRLAEFINSNTKNSFLGVEEIMQKRQQKLKEQESLQYGLAEGLKNRFYDLLNQKKFKYYCSICLIIRDENEYLKEWLEWHIKLGVQHFYIYDHGSKQPVSEFIKALNKDIQDRVSVKYYGGSHVFAQHDAYNDCLENYKYESRWIGFIDCDEMVRIKNGKQMPEYLKSFEQYAGLFIVWEMYGANGQIKKSSLPLRERFTKVSPSKRSSGVGKVFVQPLLIKKCLHITGIQ